MAMRTPLSKVRGLGSAKTGTGHFWHQRLTALANLPLILFLIFLGLSVAGDSYLEVRETLSSPIVSVLLTLALLNIGYHMYLGMQIIIEDYVHSEGAKVLALFGNTFFSSIVVLSGVFAVLKIGFGG